MPLRWHLRFCRPDVGFGFFCLCAGIRVLPSRFKRRPCAGRHLLFFAAAKKSRQKKAANTANISHCLRAPKGSYASHGNHVTHVRCQRSCGAPHPLHAPALQRAVPAIPLPPRWQTVCRLSRRIAWRSYMEVCACYRVRSEAREALRPTHSLPPGRRWTIWHGMLKRGSAKRVRRSARALATSMGHVIAV